MTVWAKERIEPEPVPEPRDASDASEVSEEAGQRPTQQFTEEFDDTPEDFGRFAATIARQLIMVTSGVIKRNAKARLLRDGSVVADNLDFSSLRREKDDVSEVREGFECGLVLKGFNDIKVGDIVETFELREKVRA